MNYDRESKVKNGPNVTSEDTVYTEKVRAEGQYYRELNIRATSDRDAPVIAVVKMGTVMHRDPSYLHPQFSKVCLQNGQEGYAMSSFLKKAY